MMDRNDEQCYSFDEIVGWAFENYGGQSAWYRSGTTRHFPDIACMFMSLGWMDTDTYQLQHEAIVADWMTLNDTVTAPLFNHGPACVEGVLAEMEKHHNPE
jgi:hypothetical protein